MNLIEIDTLRGVCKIEGKEYPSVGFGTYPLTGKICTEAVIQAAQSGYGIIDTATYYENFDGIARALNGLDRRHFYLISKVWHDMHAPEDLKKDLDMTLKELQTDYLDAYLLHWPNSEIPIKDTLDAMEDLRKRKKIRHIGLSNVTINHIKRALEMKVPIAWVQVEMSPFFYDPDLLDFCKKHAITLQAWGPLGSGRLHEDALLKRIGDKYRKKPSQVAIRWIVQHGCLPLPSSKNAKHIQENIAIRDFSLSESDMEEINAEARMGKRVRVTKEMIGFDDEFDFSYAQCWPK